MAPLLGVGVSLTGFEVPRGLIQGRLRAALLIQEFRAWGREPTQTYRNLEPREGSLPRLIGTQTNRTVKDHRGY